MQEPMPPELLKVSFSSDPGGRELVAAIPTRARPIAFERNLAVKALETVNVSLGIDSPRERAYRLGCRYRVAEPETKPDAPCRITTRIPRLVDLDADTGIDVVVTPAGKRRTHQVVARIGIPGGCRVKEEALAALVGDAFDHWEYKDGSVNVYWAEGLREVQRFTIPLKATVAGAFRTRPSMVYPYYESGKEYYGAPLTLKVFNHFGRPLTPEMIEELRRQGRR